MANLITSPVQLGFSEFVSKLVSDTFDAVISSSINQEKSWAQIHQLLGMDMVDFAEETISDDMVDVELAELFPDNEGGTTVFVGAPYQRKRESTKAKTQETPPINDLLGYLPKTSKLSQKDMDEIRRIIKLRLAEFQFELLNRVASKGATRVIVDAGKINAKINFEILQVEEGEDSSEGNDKSGTSTKNAASNIFSANRFSSISRLSLPSELQTVRFVVKPPSDSDPQTHQVKANVYGEVELTFKTIT